MAYLLVSCRVVVLLGPDGWGDEQRRGLALS